jgi:hypothetical protein
MTEHGPSFVASVPVTGRGLPGTRFGYGGTPEQAFLDLQQVMALHKEKAAGKPALRRGES